MALASGISARSVSKHFASREELLEAVYQKATESLRNGLIDVLSHNSPDPYVIGAKLVEHLRVPTNRKLLVWLLAAGRDPFPDARQQGIRRLAERVHVLREARLGAEAPFEQTVSAVLNVAFAAYGEALVGDPLRTRMGMDEIEGGDQFVRKHFVDMVQQYLGGCGCGEPDATEFRPPSRHQSAEGAGWITANSASSRDERR